MPILRFPAGTPLAEISGSLDEAGCVVVTDLVNPHQGRAIRDELSPHMASARVVDDDDPAEFYPGRTRRMTTLLARASRSCIGKKTLLPTSRCPDRT